MVRPGFAATCLGSSLISFLPSSPPSAHILESTPLDSRNSAGGSFLSEGVMVSATKDADMPGFCSHP